MRSSNYDNLVGAGNDLFVLGAGLGVDTISDFTNGQDIIQLINLTFPLDVLRAIAVHELSQQTVDEFAKNGRGISY